MRGSRRVGAVLKRALSPAFSLVLVAGCSALVDPPKSQTFLIQLDSAVDPNRAPNKPLAPVYIAPVEVSAPFSERNLVVRQSELGYVADPYAEFAANPVSMWTGVIRSWLSERQLFERVLLIDSSAEADLTLETDLMEAVVDRRTGQPPTSRLTMHFLLHQNGPPYQVLLDRTFTHSEPLKGTGAESEVAALSRAASVVLGDFEDALARIPH